MAVVGAWVGIEMIRYTVDSDDKILRIDGDWDPFARVNDAPPELAASEVLGTCLWDWIHDEPTRRIYQVLLRGLRSHGRDIRFEYRCDSIDRRRYLSLHLSSDPATGHITFESRLRREEDRDVALAVAAETRGVHSNVRMCSICRRVQGQQWAEAESVAANEGLFDRDLPLHVIYTICPTCDEHLTSLASFHGATDPTLDSPGAQP